MNAEVVAMRAEDCCKKLNCGAQQGAEDPFINTFLPNVMLLLRQMIDIGITICSLLLKADSFQQKRSIQQIKIRFGN